MSFFGRSERKAVAGQIADRLDTYKATMNEWLVAPGNLGLYERLGIEIDSIRVMSSSALPEVTGALADLVAAHTDLTFTVLKKHLVRLQVHVQNVESESQLAKAIDRHQRTLLDMHSLCVRRNRS